MRHLATLVLLLTLLFPPLAQAANCLNTSVGLTPLSEPDGLGLYPDGSNTPAYLSEIEEANAQIVRRLPDGTPSESGKYVYLSVGMSNTYQEFAQLQQIVKSDVQKDPALVVVNGAQGQWDIRRVNDPAQAPTYWATVDARLANNGVTPAQVEIIWLKQAMLRPQDYGDVSAYNVALTDEYLTLLGTLRDRFPNAHLIYLSSRSYGGYVSDWRTHPEPYAHGTGLMVRDLIALQQSRDERLAGVPLMLWHWYHWSDGTTQRADGWSAPCHYFEGDGLHPSGQGELQWSYRVRTWLRSDVTTTWYRR